jgi:hypothetical protein
LPHPAPGSPGKSRESFLSGKPIRYYRPKGSQEVVRLVQEPAEAKAVRESKKETTTQKSG